jgi:hypothetical protein
MSAPRLRDQVRAAVRLRHYSRRTEDAYVHWIKRFILFNNKRHPDELAEGEVTAFLNHPRPWPSPFEGGKCIVPRARWLWGAQPARARLGRPGGAAIC